MPKIQVLAGISVPYVQDEKTKKWTSTIGHSWKVDNPDVTLFAKEADLKIKRRSKNHGKILHPFKHSSLASLFDRHLSSEGTVSFSDFVQQLQMNNSIVLKTSRVRSKVVLIFLKYQKELDPLPDQQAEVFHNLLVVMLKDKSALRFGEDGAPLGTDIIDFDDVMQAAILDIDEFSTASQAGESVDVSFINGSGGTTDYFIDFFDAEDVVKNKESVANVIKAFKDFSEKNSVSRALRERCEERIKAHIEFNERKKFPTKLSDISSVIFNVIRDEPSIDISAESFNNFVQEYNYKVNEEFSMSKNDRDSFEFISFDTDVGALKLKKSQFGDEKSNIVFNEKNNELKIITKIKDPQTIEALKNIKK